MRKLISKIKKLISGKGRTSSPKPMPVTKGKPIGEITHYYGDINVAIVKFNRTVSCGEKVHFAGTTTDFKETIKSMQYDHKPIEKAQKGQEVGIKVGDKVRQGDEVYEV